MVKKTVRKRLTRRVAVRAQVEVWWAGGRSERAASVLWVGLEDHRTHGLQPAAHSLLEDQLVDRSVIVHNVRLLALASRFFLFVGVHVGEVLVGPRDLVFAGRQIGLLLKIRVAIRPAKLV